MTGCDRGVSHAEPTPDDPYRANGVSSNLSEHVKWWLDFGSPIFIDLMIDELGKDGTRQYMSIIAERAPEQIAFDGENRVVQVCRNCCSGEAGTADSLVIIDILRRDTLLDMSVPGIVINDLTMTPEGIEIMLHMEDDEDAWTIEGGEPYTRFLPWPAGERRPDQLPDLRPEA